jgi:hypothetical protein
VRKNCPRFTRGLLLFKPLIDEIFAFVQQLKKKIKQLSLAPHRHVP